MKRIYKKIGPKIKLMFSSFSLRVLLTTFLIWLPIMSIYSQNVPCMFDASFPYPNDKVGGAIPIGKKLGKVEFNEFRFDLVFHVLYTDSTDYVSERQILDQLEELNQAYYVCIDKARSKFKTVRGCPRFVFSLASIDPNGLQSGGIVWKRTHRKNFNFGDSTISLDYVKYSKYGGDDAWDTERYINIWVCNLSSSSHGSSLRGYAFPPLLSELWPEDMEKRPERQGVVLSNENFHSNNGQISRLNILIHELGHYFNLVHTWGNLLQSDCVSDDGVHDTPSSTSPSFYCDYSKNTCLGDANDLPDMVENYMEYTNSKCMNMFTVGQVDRMITSVYRYRPTLLIPTNYNPSSNFSIIPNSSSTGQFNVVNFSKQSLNTSISVFSTEGKLLFTMSMNEAKIQVSMSQFGKGTYLLQLNSNTISEIRRIQIVN